MAGARSRQWRKYFLTVMTQIFHNTQMSITEAEKSCLLNVSGSHRLKTWNFQKSTLEVVVLVQLAKREQFVKSGGPESV